MFPVLEADSARFVRPPSINPAIAATWLEAFLREELGIRRGIPHAIVGLSGGVDSAVTAFLCARAIGPENVYAVRMPYKRSSPSSLTDAALVAETLGIHLDTVDISAAVDGYLQYEPNAGARRSGNVIARMRMLVLFDQSVKRHALPVGTGNKTERLLGYFTWHADDAPPLNPIGDLYKTQVWELAGYLGVPRAVIEKLPTADLEVDQTDEGDLGISYAKADAILARILEGYSDARLVDRGFARSDVDLVRKRLDSTHWKRHLPTTAMLSNTAINEFYLRPVDF